VNTRAANGWYGVLLGIGMEQGAPDFLCSLTSVRTTDREQIGTAL